MQPDNGLGEDDKLFGPPGRETPEFEPPSTLPEPTEDEEAFPPLDEDTDPGEDAVTLEPPPQFLKRAAAAVEERQDPGTASALPPQPRTVADVGLSKAFLTDLTLKIVHYGGTPSAAQLVRRLGLGSAVVQQILTALGEERLVEVISQSDLYTGNYRYRLSDRGAARVAEALERSRYAGPAPVTTEQYSEVLHRHHSLRQAPSRARIKEALNQLVLPAEVADAVARALYSGKAGILYGPSGNGKTTILGLFAKHLDGTALVPHAIYAYGQIIRVFDQSVHEPLEDMDSRGVTRDDSQADRRWVLIRRPAVILGAEIGPESLDLAYDPQSRFYQASPHIKAQGGVLIVDDFGRQKMDSRDLLTRWLIPLERGWDTLGLVSGEKVTVPFSAQLLLATNLPIRQLADDALLRRILYKVEIPNPQPQDFAEIMRQLCREKRVRVSEGALEHVGKQLYGQPGMQPRASYARDILDMVIESAAFDGREPVLDRETFDKVFRMFSDQHGD